eukprot:symbB.v1.2.023937.t1/scaffold2134.1/size120077/3
MVTRKIGRKAASQWQLHLHFWVKRKCPVTACSAISACGKAQHWEKSLEIYQIWEEDNRKQLSKPAAFHDPAPLNATLAAFANAALWSSALKLLEVSPAELPGWNAAINACGRARRWSQALVLLEELHRFRVADATSVNSTISACSRHGSDVDSVHDFISMFLCLSRAANWEVALALLDWHADVIGVSAVISACANSAKWVHALSALQMHAVNEVSFAAAITACGRSTRWHVALKLFEEVYTASRASLTCFSAAVSACELGVAWQCALSLLSRAAADWPLDRVIINAAACSSAMRWTEALAMAAAAPSVVTSKAALFATEAVHNDVSKLNASLRTWRSSTHRKSLQALWQTPSGIWHEKDVVILADVARIALENFSMDENQRLPRSLDLTPPILSQPSRHQLKVSLEVHLQMKTGMIDEGLAEYS